MSRPEATQYLYFGKRVVRSLTSHMLVSGKSGSGKSNLCEYICRQYADKGAAVFDLWDSGRMENHLYGIEETDPLKRRMLAIYTRQEMQPGGCENKVLWLAGKGLERFKRLPKSVRLVRFEPDDLRIDDLLLLFGETDARRSLLAEIELRHGSISFMEAKAYLKQYAFRGSGMRNQAIALLHRIFRWEASGMFSTGIEKLDVESLAKSPGINSFSTIAMDMDVEPIAYAILLGKIYELKRRNVIQKPVIVYIREIANWMEPEYAPAARRLLRILREGRDYSVTLICDTQRPNDLAPKFRRQFGYHEMMRLDFEEAKVSGEWQYVPASILANLSGLSPGQHLTLTGAEWQYPIQASPTPHRHKTPGLDVLELLGQRDGWRDLDHAALFEKPEAPDLDKREEAQEKPSAKLKAWLSGHQGASTEQFYKKATALKVSRRQASRIWGMAHDGTSR